MPHLHIQSSPRSTYVQRDDTKSMLVVPADCQASTDMIFNEANCLGDESIIAYQHNNKRANINKMPHLHMQFPCRTQHNF
jgi:hypothetical protein